MFGLQPTRHISTLPNSEGSGSTDDFRLSGNFRRNPLCLSMIQLHDPNDMILESHSRPFLGAIG